MGFKGVPWWRKRQKEQEVQRKEAYQEEKARMTTYAGTSGGKSVSERIVAALGFKRKKENGEIVSPVVTSDEVPSTESSASLSAKPASTKSVKMIDIVVELPTVQQKYESLSNQGSRSYTIVEKMLVARAVMVLLIEWLCVIDAINERLQADAEDKLTVEEQLTLRGAVGNSPQVGNAMNPTFAKACLITAQRLGVKVENVKKWAGQLYELGYLVDDTTKRRTALIFADNALPVEYVLEIIEFIRKQALLGYRSNYRTVQAHINSDIRLHEILTLENCPRAILSVASIRRALARSGCVTFAPVVCVGRSHFHTPEQITARLWRLQVFFAQMAIAMKKEREGKVLLVQMDESFINQFHFSDYSLTETDENGKPIGQIHCNKGKGPRLCLVGAICQYGPLVTTKEDGTFVVDHAWLNAKGEKVQKHGQFAELDLHGQPRNGFEPGRGGAAAAGGTQRLDTMKRADLIAKCAELSIELPAGKVTCVVLKDLLKPHYTALRAAAVAAKAASRTKSGKDASADQAVLINFEDRAVELQDLARTTVKVFPANNGGKGDYHDNFDTETFFKWFMALLLTYPLYCQQLQDRLDSGNIVASHPFYDRAAHRPTRTLVLSLDNAPYHKGIAVQLSSKTKGQIADILRSKGISTITFSHIGVDGEVVQATAEVPDVNQQWQVGFPNAQQLREGALRALKNVDRQLVELPFMEEIRKLSGQWGPPGAPAVELLWNAPNVSPQIAIEYLWADGKNEVAKPHNQSEDRSLADISDILHTRWFSNIDQKCKRLFTHAETVMNEAIAQAFKAGGPLQGTLPDLQGLPTEAEELKMWMERAGMKEDCSEEEEESNLSDCGDGDDGDDFEQDI